MADQGDKEDRTQPASQRRLEQARAEGNAPLSRELPALFGAGATILILMMTGPQLGRAFMGRLGSLLAGANSMDLRAASREAAFAAVIVVAPIALGGLVAAAGSVLLQTGFMLKTSAMKPDFGRLNPRQGLTRMFGVNSLVEAAKSILKLLLLGVAVWEALSGVAPTLQEAVFWDPALLAERVWREVLHLALMLLGAQALIAGADIGWARYRHNKTLRMSRHEVKQESQETEGNPHVKGKLRQMRLMRAKKRMLAAVPSATVIVTNPTHYAIALVYDRSQSSAPRVVAKGVDEVAARIRTVAQDHKVPLVANPPLARALYTVEVDAEIPAEHFKAVAEIIAYVWRLRTGRSRTELGAPRA